MQTQFFDVLRQRDKPLKSGSHRPLTPKLLAQIRAEGFGRTYIHKHIRKKTRMVFACYHDTVEGIIIRRLTYAFDILSDGQVRRIEKLSIKYMYKRNQAFQIMQHIDFDETLKCRKIKGVVPKTDRYHVEDAILTRSYKENISVTSTLLGGEIITGLVDWFSRYEIKINVTNRNGVVIFRHGLYDFRVNA